MGQFCARVWDAIEDEPIVAARMKARSLMRMSVQRVVTGWKLQPASAAQRLGVTRMQLEALQAGRIDRRTLDALYGLALMAGLRPTIRMEATKVCGPPWR